MLLPQKVGENEKAGAKHLRGIGKTLLTDLVLANEADAPQIAASVRPVDTYPGLEIKDVDVVKLTALHAICTGEIRTNLLAQYPMVAQRSADGPWVLLIPQRLVTQLVDLQGDRLREVAARWAAIEEFKFGRWTESMVRETLDKIIQLAQQATTQGKRLFLWMSL